MNCTNFTIKNLELFENLNFSIEENKNTTKLEWLYKYENKVSPTEINPDIKMFLTNEEFLGYGFYGDDAAKDKMLNFIPQGKYMFLQGIGEKNDFQVIQKAAETLFLESLWQEKKLGNITYLRFLQEGEKTVFQLFRAIL